MEIQSQGQMTPETVKKLIRCLSKNEKLLTEASAVAKKNLPYFMEKAFDIPKENMELLRKILTPHFSALLIEFMLESIRNNEDVEIVVEPSTPRADGEISLLVSMEIAVSSTPTAGGPAASGPTKKRVRCKPEDGTGHPQPGQ